MSAVVTAGTAGSALVAGSPLAMIRLDALPAVSMELRIALLVFAFTVCGILAVMAVVASLKGWSRPAVESRLRALEAAQQGGDPLASILRSADVADLRGLSLGSGWLQELSLANRMQRRLAQAGLEMSVGEFVGCVFLAAVIGGAVGYVAGWHDWRLLVPVVVAACLPFVWLARRRAQRLDAFGAHLPDALELMSGSLRAGHAYSSAVQMVGDEMTEPIASEFRTMAEEYRVGINHRECLDRLVSRVDHPDLQLFAISVLIQSETGGNLAQVLDGLAATIRSRFTLLGRIRAITAEGRLSGIVLAVLPVVVAGILSLMNPEYMEPLFRTTVGRVGIAAALTLQLLGYLWIRKIVRVRA